MVLFKKNLSVGSVSDINSDSVLKPFRVGNVADVLPDDELKRVLGGIDGTCGYSGYYWRQIEAGPGGGDPNFIYAFLVWELVYYSECGISYSSAQRAFEACDEDCWWCCDSCNDTSYCG